MNWLTNDIKNRRAETKRIKKYAKELIMDKKKAKKFLQKAGIITKTDKLTKPYKTKPEDTYPIKIDDIWVAIGGIGQTRADFYKVMKFTEKTVWLTGVPSKCIKNDGRNWVWHVRPDLKAPLGQIEKRKLCWSQGWDGKDPRTPYCNTGSSSYMGSARPWDGKTVIESGMY